MTGMVTGIRLVRNMESYQPKKGELAFWWLGQQSFIIKSRNGTAYLDPYLSPGNGRLIPPLLKPEEATNADIIMGSHDHGDHIDRGAWPGLAAASPQARFILPGLLRQKIARELHLNPVRLTGLDAGKSVTVSGMRITGIAAAHEFLDRDPSSGRYPYLGFVIETDGVVIYHSGDCCVYEGLQSALKAWKFDAVFLPINGRDAKRLAAGCIGNMTYQEAADLAGSLRPGCTIPGHFDMFAMNQEDPRLFRKYMQVKYPRLRVQVPKYGVRTIIGRILPRA